MHLLWGNWFEMGINRSRRLPAKKFSGRGTTNCAWQPTFPWVVSPTLGIRLRIAFQMFFSQEPTHMTTQVREPCECIPYGSVLSKAIGEEGSRHTTHPNASQWPQEVGPTWAQLGGNGMYIHNCWARSTGSKTLSCGLGDGWQDPKIPGCPTSYHWRSQWPLGADMGNWKCQGKCWSL